MVQTLWFADFPHDRQWNAFCNQVIATLTAKFSVTHKLSTVYESWLNGAVERVNRDVYRLRNRNNLLLVIQSCVNHSPVESQGNKCPMKICTGLPPPTLLGSFVAPDGDSTTANTVHKVVESRKRSRQQAVAMHHLALLSTLKWATSYCGGALTLFCRAPS